MPTLSIAERRARRAARKGGKQVGAQPLPGTFDAGALPASPIPHEAVTDSPPPSVTADMAQGQEHVVRGNSNLQPMNQKGHQTVQRVGAELAALGGPDEIQPSASLRTVQTAQDVSAKTGAPIRQPSPALESHAIGNLEGEVKTPDVKRYLSELMRKAPDLKIPGQGAMSTRQGESFNEFRTRALSAVRGLMQRLASNPTARILVPTSTQVIRLVDAWCAAGCPDDLSVSPEAYLKETSGSPGDIERFWPESGGKWGLTPFKPESAKDFPPGLYFMRHGETDSVQAQKAEAGQKARAQLMAHIRAGRWKEARDTAKTAIHRGHLSEDAAGAAVDESLPTANDAQRLSPHELLSAVSAAGPSKQAELMPVLQSKLGSMEGIEPAGQQAIRSHLGRIRG